MAWVRLIAEARLLHANDTVQDSHLFGIFGIQTKAPFELQLEVLRESGLIQVKTCICAKRREVIPVHDHGDLPSWMIEAARRGATLFEPTFHQCAHIPSLQICPAFLVP